MSTSARLAVPAALAPEVRGFLTQAAPLLRGHETKTDTEKLLALLHHEHPGAKMAAFNLLCVVCSDKTNAKAARELGLLKEFTAVLSPVAAGCPHAQWMTMQTCAISVICALADDDANKDAIIASGCLPKLGQLIAVLTGRALDNALKAVSLLSNKRERVQALAAAGIYQRVAASLTATKNFPDKTEQFYTPHNCLMIVNALSKEQCVDTLASSGLLAALFEAAAVPTTLADVALSCVITLTASAPGRAIILSNNYHLVLVARLESLENPDTIAKILNVLTNLCYEESGAEKVLAAPNLVRCLVDTLGSVPSTHTAAVRSLGLLMSLSRYEKFFADFHAAGGVEQLAETAKDLSGDTPQEHIAVLIGNLFTEDQLLSQCVDEGYLRMVVSLMKSKNMKIVQHASRAVANICTVYDQYRVQLFDEGVVAPLSALLLTNNAEVKYHGLRAMMNLALCYTRTPELLQNRQVLNEVVGLMSCSDNKLRGASASFVTNLTANEMVRPYLVQEVGLQPVFALLSAQVKELKLSALKILSNYCIEGRVRKMIAESSQMVAALENAKRINDSDIQAQAQEVDSHRKFPFEKSYPSITLNITDVVAGAKKKSAATVAGVTVGAGTEARAASAAAQARAEAEALTSRAKAEAQARAEAEAKVAQARAEAEAQSAREKAAVQVRAEAEAKAALERAAAELRAAKERAAAAEVKAATERAARAEAEARVKAAAAARARAEAEAQAMALREAEQRAARAKADAEAKAAQARAQAQAQAEAEARAVRAKAEAEVEARAREKEEREVAAQAEATALATPSENIAIAEEMDEMDENKTQEDLEAKKQEEEAQRLAVEAAKAKMEKKQRKAEKQRKRMEKELEEQHKVEDQAQLEEEAKWRAETDARRKAKDDERAGLMAEMAEAQHKQEAEAKLKQLDEKQKQDDLARQHEEEQKRLKEETRRKRREHREEKRRRQEEKNARLEEEKAKKMLEQEEIMLREREMERASAEEKQRRKAERAARRKARELAKLKAAEEAKTSAAKEAEEAARIHRKRTYIAQEILSTEKSYVDGLNILIRNYVKPLSTACGTSNQIVSREDVKSLFSNIEIITNFNTVLLEGLTARLSTWSENTLLGDIFVHLAAFLRCYVEYVNNYDSALALLAALRRDNKKFAAFVKQMETLNRDLPLYSIMIFPIQRVPRYVLLLTDLLKNTPTSHPDCDTLKKALQSVRTVGDDINESKRHSEKLLKLHEVQSCVVGHNLPQLIEAHRTFVRDGMCKIVKGGSSTLPGVLHLFNDGLLVCEFKNKSKFKYKRFLMLSTVTVLQQARLSLACLTPSRRAQVGNVKARS
eukprot:TRINITY_DN4436_c0_g1_i2.p1 TRINITY_DN4436_c0_g1~~TRINITY_DN4436_c0_g1_i2.p1  ORF type:complete len:1333 (+),score=393.10 TRINITY_DN4436_c0_g1_i2:58-4056(+)